MAQPGCGQLLVQFAAPAPPLAELKIKGYCCRPEKKKCHRLANYQIRRTETLLYIDHYEGLHEISIKRNGKKMKLKIDNIKCSENYLIDELRWEPGQFDVQLNTEQLQRTPDNTDQRYPCSACLRIPFNQFVKEH